tara:strand:- start:10314 stop:11168 length:855 start_codon:yes stop_codon:yes gene_type:complete
MNFIPETNVSVQQGEDGVIINFGLQQNLPARDTYIISFTPETKHPAEPEYTIAINPATYSISNTNNFEPITIVYINSVHDGETQSLIKMEVKDIYGSILSTKYYKIICNPTDNYSTSASFESTGQNSVGPNGGSVLILESTGSINVGSTLSAPPDIPVGTTVTSIISSTRVEVSPSLVTNTFSDIPVTFNLNVGCGSAESLRRRLLEDKFIYLDSSNNWEFKYQDKTLAKFINLHGGDDLVVRMPAKNKSLFPGVGDPSLIPSISKTTVSGRTYALGPCASGLT